MAQNHSRNTVHFLGHYPDIRTVYVASDLLIHFSSMDAFPNAVLEAQACGRPVIVNDFGGMPEQIIDGETGYVVDSQETQSVQSLVERLLYDPYQRTRMGQAGQRFVETHYSSVVVGERFAQALRFLSRSRERK
jgi:glycosyltransferase involved in cell wall biosynthesis